MNSLPLASVRTGAVTIAVVAALLGGCGDQEDPSGTDEPGGSASDSATTSASATPSESPSASESPEQATVGVYYVVDTRAGLRLAREEREVPAADAPAAGVAAMVSGAADADYATTWDPGTTVLGVSRSGKRIVVDLSAEARTADVGSEGAALMVQQLVYTVTDAVGENVPVQLLIEGKPAGELWGAVTWGESVRRADPLDVRQLVQIDTPTEGAAVSSPVTVTGEASAFEANVPWRVLDQRGKIVKKGFTTAAEAFTFAAYSFTVKLNPGTYTIEVREDDPSGGEAGPPMVDTKTVVVE